MSSLGYTNNFDSAGVENKLRVEVRQTNKIKLFGLTGRNIHLVLTKCIVEGSEAGRI